MAKKVFFSIVVFLFVFSAIGAQEKTTEDADSLPKRNHCADVLHIPTAKKRANEIIESVFKPSPGLSNADSIVKYFDQLPSFSIYKNNYIVTGTTIGHNPSDDNSDAKFQISIMQKLTNSILPFKTYLFLTYTQLAFWDIYKESFPFSDLNFNPTVGLGKALVHKNRLLGMMFLQLEHESNGKDAENSRSWNKLSLATILMLDHHWVVQPKLWIPFVDGQNNKNLVSYKGWGHLGVDYNNRRLNVGMLLTKRAGAFFDYNVTLNASYKMFKNENQHLFIEYYNGYGENLLMYKQYRHRIRIGFVIMPGFMRIY